MMNPNYERETKTDGCAQKEEKGELSVRSNSTKHTWEQFVRSSEGKRGGSCSPRERICFPLLLG